MIKVGEKFPDFDLIADDGKHVTLRDLKGKPFVLYFYPKDDTPGCTQEACAFRDDYKIFKDKNVLLFGVSLDDTKSHVSFKKKFDLPFPLLSDPGATVSKALEVYKEKSMYGRKYWGIERTTFIIDAKQKLVAIFPKVKVTGHSQEIISALP